MCCFVGIQNLLRLDFEQKSVIRGQYNHSPEYATAIAVCGSI